MGNSTQYFCPDKQQQAFSVDHVVAIEEVENVSNMVHEPGILKCLMSLHQNVSFALFAKFGLKTGMHMNFYFIAASQLLQKIWCMVKLSIHYYMIAFIIVWYLHVS